MAISEESLANMLSAMGREIGNAIATLYYREFPGPTTGSTPGRTTGNTRPRGPLPGKTPLIA